MPITFPCACGVTLSVREDPPIYFAFCPVCRATSKVPRPKKKPAAPAADDPGFELVDAVPPQGPTAGHPKVNEEDEAWEKTPYQKPAVGNGYGVKKAAPVKKGATKGDGRGDPYEVSQEEFEEEARERKGSHAARKLRRALWVGVAAVVGIGAFAGVGLFTRSVDPGRNGRAGAALGRIAILATMLIVMLVIWLVNQGGDDD
ncbi:MAG: hypothetical protein JWO38_7295 [Gemmataceae bacterium]|nr:hypothetical protein [Gemmataceae bacterium]